MVASSDRPTRGVLGERFRQVRGATEALAEDLSPEDCVAQSMPDASPVKWHLAHTTWFFETFVLEPWLPGYQTFEPVFREMFNSYYESVGAQHARPERGLLTRPSLQSVMAYRQWVEAGVERWLHADPAPPASSLAVLELGCHHEQQHQELILTDVKHLFSRNPLRPAYRKQSERLSRTVAALSWQSFEGGLLPIGASPDEFAFDNERPVHRVYLDDFELASRPATNAEYRAFVEDGGYRDPLLWLSDGWDWVSREGLAAPLYWERLDRDWQEFTLGGRRELIDSDPVCHLSFFEADAFARWAGARLPTEAEWERAAQHAPRTGNLLESGALHPVAAGDAEGAGAVQQIYGDVWEWTASPYVAYPGWRPPAGALGEYNGKFMSNQMVLRGGSCVTPAAHVRATYRNFFPPSARWQFTGVRLARDA